MHVTLKEGTKSLEQKYFSKNVTKLDTQRSNIHFLRPFDHSVITALPVESGLALKFKATEGPI